MFLITTADRRFWRTDKKVLFLGEWCNLYSDKMYWEGISNEMLPYHWDDRQKLYNDYLYLDGLQERLLGPLTRQLNQIHGETHSIRYWRIILGPWLYYFINIFFDRYQSILTAEKSGKATHTLIGAYDNRQWLPRNHLDLVRSSISDEYNQFLFSRIIQERNTIPFEVLEIKSGNTITGSHRIGSFKKRVMRKLLRSLSRWVPDRFNQVVFVSVPITRKDQAKLQLSMGQLPYLYSSEVQSPNSKIDFRLRRELSLNSARDNFEEILFRMIVEQIPSNYLENYHEMKRRSLDAFPKKPRVIFTSVAYESDEGFKFWAAHNVERGCKYTVSQHGMSGVMKWFQEEEYQIKTCDWYYTWGWRSDDYNNIKPLPTPKLSHFRKTVRPKPDGRILLLTYVWPRYAYKLYSVPIGASGMLAFLNEQFLFANALSEEAKKLLLVRLFPNDREWNQRERWAENVPRVECYGGYGIPMSAQMNQSRLMVTAPNGTPCIEALMANFPTVLFRNPKYFEPRHSVQPYFDELSRVGVLHDTPESAANLVNKIYKDPISWWLQPEIQKAISEFCYQFGRISDNWLQEWKSEFLNLAKNSKTINSSKYFDRSSCKTRRDYYV